MLAVLPFHEQELILIDPRIYLILEQAHSQLPNNKRFLVTSQHIFCNASVIGGLLLL